MIDDLKQRQRLAEFIVNFEPTETIRDLAPLRMDELPEIEALPEPMPWPKERGRSLAPRVIALSNRKPTSSLPKADVVAVTWTVAEGFALGDVLTPGYRDVRGKKAPPKNTKPWYPYRPANFTDYLRKLRKGAPARKADRLGSYCLTSIYNDNLGKNVKVLCFKSELHLNRDWTIVKRVSDRTVPVADLFVQIIDECQPKLVITVGTAGATLSRTALGDVMITRAAKFRLSKAFARAPFRDAKFTCKNLGSLTLKQLATLAPLLQQYAGYLPPKMLSRAPKIWFDGTRPGYSKFFPILTTDSFEFGTTPKGKGPTNYLGGQGCGVEMGDAVLGMVAEYLKNPSGKPPWEFKLAKIESLESAMQAPPLWLVIRNASDPQIDANLSKKD